VFARLTMNILDQPSVAFRPAAMLSGTPGPSAGHLPFACDLIAALKPQTFVQLGVDYGDTYFGFCQAVQENSVTCTCYGVDTWPANRPDAPAFDAVNSYNERHHRSFSYLLKSTFDEAIRQFSDGSIGILHIAGVKTYEAARHAFERWFPKVRPGGVILLDDIAVRLPDYGVWRLWEELGRKFQAFAFPNNNGLGVLWKPGGPQEKNPYLCEIFSTSGLKQDRILQYYGLCAAHLELTRKLERSANPTTGQPLLQVVPPRHGEYPSEAALTQPVEPGKWVNVCVPLPEGTPTGALRLDPVNRPAVIDIASIVLRQVAGRTVWSWNPRETTAGFRIAGTSFRLPSTESLRILSFGQNPQLFLPETTAGALPAEALELEVRIRIDLELRAIEELAQQSGAAANDLAVELAAALEEERNANHSAKAEREKMQAARGLLSQELAIARGNVEDLKGELEHITTLQGQAESDLLDLRRANGRIAAALEVERMVRAKMESSLSWRLTAPLRKLQSRFGSADQKSNYR
jgi:Methyltransferase domain